MIPGPPGSSRPRHDGAPVRILFAVFGTGLWMLGQVRLDGLFSFLGDGMASYATGGLLAAVILWPFWKRFRLPVGLMGVRSGFPAAMASLALLAPFLVVAVSTDPVWSAPSLRAWFTMAVSLLLLAATEEIVCRGFLMDILSIGGRVGIGLLLSSAAFASLHIWNNGVSVAGIANIFLAGILFGLLRLTTGGLLWPFALHWVWNLFTGMVFGWSVSGHESMPTLFTCREQPPWGGFGPEESVLMTIGVVGASLLLLHKLRPGLNSTQIEKLPEILIL
jgi:membrane protease YdiL (CAAX protease family)